MRLWSKRAKRRPSLHELTTVTSSPDVTQGVPEHRLLPALAAQGCAGASGISRRRGFAKPAES